MIDEINNLLEKHNQKLRVIKYDSNEIIFNNGVVITNNITRAKFLRRRRNKKYIVHFDEIYQNDVELSEKTLFNIRSKMCSEFGKKAWTNNREEMISKMKGRIPWNKNKIVNTNNWCKGLTKDTDERLKKLSIDRMGSNNPMYGTIKTDEEKKNLSNIMKKKILNGEFTPNIHNSRTHWQSVVDNSKKFRSSWEAVYYILNSSLNYEKIRISYNFKGEHHIYIVDFVDEKNKVLIEVKPSSTCSLKDKSKWEAAIKWGKENGYIFKIINEEYFINEYDNINFNRLDEKSRDVFNRGINNEIKKKKRDKKRKNI